MQLTGNMASGGDISFLVPLNPIYPKPLNPVSPHNTAAAAGWKDFDFSRPCAQERRNRLVAMHDFSRKKYINAILLWTPGSPPCH